MAYALSKCICFRLVNIDVLIFVFRRKIYTTHQSTSLLQIKYNMWKANSVVFSSAIGIVG